jgi:hypothetical protein
MPPAYRSRLTGSELIAFGKRTVTSRLQGIGCDVTAPANRRDGKLSVRTESGRGLEVFVSTQRVGGYAFWTKRRLQPARGRFAAVVLLDAGPDTELYLVPSTEWLDASAPLTDRDYAGQASEPEYGIELGASSLLSLRRFAWNDRVAREHFS